MRNILCRQRLCSIGRKTPLHGVCSFTCCDSGCGSRCDSGCFTRCGSCYDLRCDAWYDSSYVIRYDSCCDGRDDACNDTCYGSRNDSCHDSSNSFSCGSGRDACCGTCCGSSNDIRRGSCYDSSDLLIEKNLDATLRPMLFWNYLRGRGLTDRPNEYLLSAGRSLTMFAQRFWGPAQDR